MLVAVSAAAQTVRYIHTDGLGSVVLTTDKDRNTVERSEYEPYGSLLNRPMTDGPGYIGHVMDAATGLTYMQQRYYDPGIGKMLSVDPVTAYGSSNWKQVNRYAYAINNPYYFTDPDGREASCISRNTGCGISQEAFSNNMGKLADGLEAVDELSSALPPQIGGLEHMAAVPLIKTARALTTESKAASSAIQG
ncbi:RHS repeat domain-containing protein, partial [Xanthomonas graminis]|uniref:RHS repeat domain-containing protein n=1 Tax=Xanthomonas graminis TaxID=3390026 RepID=UPI002116A85B